MATKLSNGDYLADDGVTTGTRDEMYLRDASDRQAARINAPNAFFDMSTNLAALLLIIVVFAIAVYIGVRMLWPC
ncbi:hypothetical protein AGMMS4952_01980 [Spirochaetia bacterium]|nr:hypothetical protein AGMMS4952_01980 [Spirochaetia bacterium]